MRRRIEQARESQCLSACASRQSLTRINSGAGIASTSPFKTVDEAESGISVMFPTAEAAKTMKTIMTDYEKKSSI